MEKIILRHWYPDGSMLEETISGRTYAMRTADLRTASAHLNRWTGLDRKGRSLMVQWRHSWPFGGVLTAFEVTA